MAIQSLERKTALVTGGAKRLGRAVAIGLADAGANVVIHYNTSSNAAEELRRLLLGKGVNAWTLGGDLSQPRIAEGLFDVAEQEAGDISILINSASIFPSDGLRDVDEASLEPNIRINALAPFLMTKALAARGREGSVINFLDTRIVDYDREHVSYHLSKRMLFSLTRMSALEFAPRLRVNGIAPGLILPPPGKDETYLAGMAHTNPLNTYAGAEDIVDTALFLLRSRFVTGQVVYVDGGRHMLGGVYG